MPEPSDDVARQPPSPQPDDDARRDEPAGPSANQGEAAGAAGSPQPGATSFSFERTFSFGKQLPRDLLSPEALDRLRAGGSLSAEELEALRVAISDPEAVVLEGPARRFSWTWPGKDTASDADAVRQPATYYEALTRKPDPQRDFFITARRILNIGTWVFALGIPIGIVALAIATGQSFETTFFMGLAALIVGMMLKSTFPRTPFG